MICLLPLLLVGTLSAQSPDLASRSRAASRAMEEGRFDEAVGLYRELLKSLPRDAGLLMNLGMALAMSGQESEALEPLQRAIKLNPSLTPAHLFLGSSYLALGQPAEAVSPLQRVVAAEPNDVEHRRMLARAFAESGRAQQAITELRKVTDLAPKDPVGWYALAHAYNALAQESLEAFDQRPQNAPWQRLLLADALFADGRLTEAFAIYREVEPQLSSMVSIHDAIARIYEQTEHPEWAAVERAKGKTPASACLKRKALCEFRSGRHRAALVAALAGSDPESRYWRVRAGTELALAAFKRLEDLPDSRQRREVRATMARAARRYTDAVTELKAALAFAPGDPGLLDDLGTAYYAARDYEQALATLEPLVKQNPKDSRLLTVYGDSLAQLGRLDDAVAALRRAVELDPASAMAGQLLGRAYVQQGDFAAAIPLLEPQLAGDKDGSLHIQLARAYAGAGQKEKAQALLERAQQLQQTSQEQADVAAKGTITPPK